MLDKHHLHGDRVLLIMKFNAYESMICIKQGIFKQKIHQNKARFWCGFFSLSFYLSSSSSSFLQNMVSLSSWNYCVPSWVGTQCVAQAVCELGAVFLPQPPKRWITSMSHWAGRALYQEMLWSQALRNLTRCLDLLNECFWIFLEYRLLGSWDVAVPSHQLLLLG